MESLNRNQTLTLVDLSKDSKTIGCRYVFRKKDKAVQDKDSCQRICLEGGY